MKKQSAPARIEHYKRLMKLREEKPDIPLPIFCRKHKISTWTYYYWRKRLSEIGQKKHTHQPSFIPIRINREAESGVMPESGFEIVFPNGVVVRGKGSIDHSTLSAIATLGT